MGAERFSRGREIKAGEAAKTLLTAWMSELQKKGELLTGDPGNLVWCDGQGWDKFPLTKAVQADTWQDNSKDTRDKTVIGSRVTLEILEVVFPQEKSPQSKERQKPHHQN